MLAMYAVSRIYRDWNNATELILNSLLILGFVGILMYKEPIKKELNAFSTQS
jgi:hypothetical protein